MAKGKKTGGRTAGVPNKATREIKALAQSYGAEAIKMLVELARDAESDAVRVSAIKELLDRGYGKSPQPIETPDGPLAILVLKDDDEV
jgi:hypothetical protein